MYIKICDEEYFEQVLITPILQDNKWKVNLRCEFNTKIKTGRKLFYQLKKPDGEIITSGEKEVGFNNFIEMDIGVESPSIWTLQNPELYTCEVALGYEKEYVKFGFRKAEFKEGKFYLSGERIFLNGLTRKPSYPYACLAMPKSAQEQDAVILKNELGVNVVRCSEPPSKHFLNMCDKIGLMVFVEMPGTDGLSVNFENQQLILKKIKDMIYENYNHPSIILWGIRIKKTDINNDFYNKAIMLAEDLDKSRQTAGNRSFTGSKLFSSDFCIKEKVQNGSGKSKKCIIPEIGQNNIDAKSYEGELIRQNQALDYADDINKALSHKKFAGTIGQSMCDYNSTNTYGGGDNIKYSGVLDMFRVEKTSGIFYKSQQDKIPVLELTSSLATAERYKKGYGKIYIITNCDYVKFYKDEKLIKTYYPDKKHFSKLAHPPIEFDDFIGEELAENEKFSPSSAKVIKKALLYLAENGGDFIGGNKFKLMPLGKVLKKEDVSVHEFLRLYDKYICNRECKTYKLEGYIDNKLVITLNKGCSDDKKLEVKSDSEKLVENETYDTTRVVVKEKSDLGVLLNYGFDTITVKTNDLLEIIGPEKFTLIGGRRAFWVKTKGKSGKGEVTVTSDFGSETLEIEVIKKQQK